MAKLPVIIVLKAIDQASAGIKGITASLEKLNVTGEKSGKKGGVLGANQKKATNALKNISGAAATTGAAMTASLTIPIAAMGTSLVRSAADFELGMADLAGRTRAVGKDFEALQNTARELGVSTGFGFRGAIEGMTALGKAGLDTNQILASTETALFLARAEGIGTGDAADILTNTAKVFQIPFSQIKDVGDMLGRTSDISSIGITDIGNSLKYAGLAAAKVNIPLEEVSALIATLGENQIRGETAGTAFRSMITTITGDAKDIEKLKSYGISGDDLFIDGDVNRLRPLKDVFTALGPVLKDNIASTSIFGKEFGTVIQGMYRQLDLYDKNLVKMRDREGQLGFLAGKKQNTFWGQIDQLKAAFDDIGAGLEQDGTLQILQDFVTVLKDLMKGFKSLSPQVKVFIFAMAGVLAVVGPILGLLGLLGFAIAGLSALSLPIVAAFAGWGFAIGVVVAMLGLVAYKWTEIKAGAIEVWDSIKAAAADFFDFTDMSFSKLFDKLKMLKNVITKPATYFMGGGLSSDLAAGFTSLFSSTKPPMQLDQYEPPRSGLITGQRNYSDFLEQKASETKVIMDFKNAPFGTTVEEAQRFGSKNTSLEMGFNGQTTTSRGKITATLGGRR